MSFSNLLVACLGARASLSGPRQLSTDSLGRTGWHKVCRSILRNDSYFPFIDKHLVKDFVRSRVPGLAIARELQYFDSAAVTSMTRWPQIDDGGRTHLLKATHLSGGVMLVQPNSTKCLKVPCRLGSGRKLAPGRVVTGVAQSRAAQLASCRHWNTFSYGKQTRETVLYSRVARGCLLERAIGGLTAQRDMKLFVFGGRLAFVKTHAKRFQERDAQEQISINDEHDVAYFSYPSWTRLHMYEAVSLHPFAPEPRPPYLEAMVADAEALAAGFASVRVDFMAQASTYAFSELTFSHGACDLGAFMPFSLELLYGSLATTGRGLSDGGSLEEQQVQLIAEQSRTHAWSCNPKRVCSWKHRRLV